MKHALTILLAAGLLIGCAPPAERDELFQVATIESLLAGDYDGLMTCGRLAKRGDFGLGTFDKLDGEMIVLDGVIYQAKLDGTIVPIDPGVTTPFAAVTTFDADATSEPLEAMTFAELRQRVDGMLTSLGRPYAVRIDGVFRLAVIRSVPRQSPPYVPLTEALKGQAIRELHDVRGTLVGFVIPAYLAHLNVVGHHYHFISEDRQVGGHVLDVIPERVTISVDDCSSLQVLLPEDAPSAPTGVFR